MGPRPRRLALALDAGGYPHAAYGEGLARIEALTRRLAAAHGASAVGSFDPASAGCTEALYIDAEHSRPTCLARVLRQVPGL